VLLWLFHFLKCPSFFHGFFFLGDTWWVSREYLADITKEKGRKSYKINQNPSILRHATPSGWGITLHFERSEFRQNPF
jgi:hypothetical protein